MRRSKGPLGLDAALTLATAPATAVGSDASAKATQCSTCHGANGLSKAPDAPNFVSQSEQYSVKALQGFRSGARVREMMSMVAKGLSGQDIQAVSTYFSIIAISVKAPQSYRRAPSLGAASAGQASQANTACGVLPSFVITLMRTIMLGASAEGGFPQWDYNCRNCVGYRAGMVRALARTQSSIAVSTNGLDWLLINASPDILTQIRAMPALQPGRATCDAGIAVVLLMGAQVGHVIGLMMLCEGGRLRMHCTASIWEDLTERLSLMRVLAHYCGVDWQPIALDTEVGLQRPFEVAGIHHLRIMPFPFSSKVSPYSSRRLEPDPDDNISILLENMHTGRKTFYIPGLGVIEPHITTTTAGANCVLVDETFWTEDEMVRSDLSSKLAREIGHLPLSGGAGMSVFLNTLGARHKIVVHINNSDPVLDDDSVERAELTRYSVKATYGGMEIEL